MFRLGHIDQIGDASKADEVGRYRVRLDDEDIVTGWIFLSKQQVRDNVEDYTLDLQTPVWLLLSHNNREGIIGGCVNNKNNPQKVTDPDIEQKFFKDESYVKYDRNNHLYEIKINGDGNKVNLIIEGGELNVTCRDMKVTGKLTVTEDVVFEKKLNVTQDITGSADVKAGAISLNNHTHPYVDTTPTGTINSNTSSPT